MGCDTDECYEACGIAAVAREEGVELVDIKKDKDLINSSRAGLPPNISHVKLPACCWRPSTSSTCPSLKAHASMVFSGALEEHQGRGAGSGPCSDAPAEPDHGHDGRVVGLPRRHQHHGRDARRQRLLPHTPVPIEVDCIMGSYDPVALDRIACELVGIDPDGVDYFRVAQEAGLGTTNRDDIEVVGDKVADCYKKMWSLTWRTSATAGPSMRSTVRAPAPAVRPC